MTRRAKSISAPKAAPAPARGSPPSIFACRPRFRRRSRSPEIEELNRDDNVDGILVQLPLPRQIDAEAVIAAIDPAKDVDGFHPINVGRLWSGAAGLVPCTPQGCMLLLRTVHRELSGAEAVVLGRSNIVGKPMAALLLGRRLHGHDGPLENRAMRRRSAGAPTF